MAHNDFDILYEILKALDHERNDIFIHVDKKTKDFPEEKLKSAVERGKLYFIPRINVAWGGYSQIECEMNLMEYAVKEGKHDYYHMSTGATFPLKSVEEILDFFDRNKGYEFIGYDNSKDYSGRVQRYNIFNEIGKAKTKLDQKKAFCRNKFRGLQKRLNYIYKPARNIVFKKGFVYWSLTENAVTYALERKREIKKIFKHSFCGDELFMQTIIFHSPYKEKIYDYEHEYESCLRYVKPVQSWNPAFSGSSVAQTNLLETGICTEDIQNCTKSDRLFGLKFVNSTGLEAINCLKEIERRNKE